MKLLMNVDQYVCWTVINQQALIENILLFFSEKFWAANA